MSQDLKSAIAWARDLATLPGMHEKYTLLADVAQKWLDSQPKSVWVVRIWFGHQSAPRTTKVGSLQAARDLIDAAIMNGAVKFEIEHPPVASRLPDYYRG